MIKPLTQEQIDSFNLLAEDAIIHGEWRKMWAQIQQFRAEAFNAGISEAGDSSSPFYFGDSNA